MKYIILFLDILHGVFRGLAQLGRVLLAGLLWALTPILYPLQALSAFFFSWLASRELRFLIEGFPAALLAVAVSASVYAAWLPSKNNQLNTYLQRALRLHEAGDEATAELLMKKVESLSGKYDAVNFRRGINYELMGKYNRAFQIMQELAPVEEAGYLPAHEWLADKLAKLTDKKAQYLLKVHIDHILHLSPGHAGVHRFQAVHFLQRGEFQLAVYHLSRAVRTDPSLHLQYASLLYRLKLAGIPIDEEIKDDAKNQAELAIRYYKRRLERESLKMEERKETLLSWSAALVLLGEHRQAVVMLREKMSDPDDADVRNMLGEIYVSWARAVPQDDPQVWVKKFELLNSALEYAPESPAVISQLGVMSTMEGPDADKADQLLHELLAQGRARAAIHFILGTRSAEKEDFEVAIYHLESAVELNGKVLGALNNLAWTLLQGKNPNPGKSLDFINRALKLEPENPNYRETRGQAQFLLGNWRAAISDLEYAIGRIKELESLPKMHDSLAVAYGKIGDRKMAAIHEKKANAVRKELAKSGVRPKPKMDSSTADNTDETETPAIEESVVAPFVNGETNTKTDEDQTETTDKSDSAASSEPNEAASSANDPQATESTELQTPSEKREEPAGEEQPSEPAPAQPKSQPDNESSVSKPSESEESESSESTDDESDESEEPSVQ